MATRMTPPPDRFTARPTTEPDRLAPAIAVPAAPDTEREPGSLPAVPSPSREPVPATT
jgi:hypothetical protein